MIEKIRKFADSTPFANANKVMIASVLPVLIFSYFGLFKVGFAFAIGAFLTYPSDIPSNLRHKVIGVLVGALIVAGCNLFINILHPYPIFLYPLLAILLFFLSMLSVYGHRANMIAFSGLLSTSLAFGHLNSDWSIFTSAGLMFGGGLFYLLITVIFHYIRPHRYTELQLASSLRHTSKYLKLRGDLWSADANREKIVEKQLHLQVELNTIHDNLREIIMRNRPDVGNSEQNRKMLLVFISLVEIMELAISASFDHSKIQKRFSMYPNVLSSYQNLAYSLSATLKQIARSLENSKHFVPRRKMRKYLAKFDQAIKEFGANEPAAEESVWMLTNMLHYAEKQIEKIKVIERVFSEKPDLKALKGRDKDIEKFLSPIIYPLSTLIENLSFSSSIFRHSLRLTFTILLSFVIGYYFPLQNIYWILITLIVIMRPGFGLTKSRSYQRIVGTILGGAIAFGILSLVQIPAIIGTLVVISMVLGFTFTAINYRIGVTFVTMYVILLYGMLTPNIENVIQYRIVDTLVAAALAFFANYFFWPSWEFKNLPMFLKDVIQANRDYIAEISLLYNTKGDVTTSYKLARKNAFVGVGNLMASYQRMSQEPKSKQKNISTIYKLAVLNHTLLSAAASLGTYIQSRSTTSASEAFNVIVDKIIENLSSAVRILNLVKVQEIEQTAAIEDLAMRFTELRNLRFSELDGDPASREKYDAIMQEANLVIEQLIWLNGLSEQIVATAQKLKKFT